MDAHLRRFLRICASVCACVAFVFQICSLCIRGQLFAVMKVVNETYPVRKCFFNRVDYGFFYLCESGRCVDHDDYIQSDWMEDSRNLGIAVACFLVILLVILVVGSRVQAKELDLAQIVSSIISFILILVEVCKLGTNTAVMKESFQGNLYYLPGFYITVIASFLTFSAAAIITPECIARFQQGYYERLEGDPPPPAPRHHRGARGRDDCVAA